MSVEKDTNENSTSTSPAAVPNEMQRKTWFFVGTAAACLAVTGLFEVASRPAPIKEFGKVGQEFYPEFEDPTTATGLSVAVIDAEAVRPMEFSVKQASNGQWVIPSHHNYPADAADRLAKTASSVLGITRGAMVTRWEADHAKYGVVDPERDTVEVEQLAGIGKRLTLRGTDDSVLASYIIGNKVEGETDQYYVRHPGEDETYIADLDIDLSTKFTDWIETELLDISDFDVRRVVLNDYSFEERGAQLAVTNTVASTLSRETSSADWELDGSIEEGMEVDTKKVDDTVSALAGLELAGVRPKQPGLTGDLKLDRAALKSQRDLDRMQSDLLSRGFLLQPNKDDPEALRLISREGEMTVGTEDGLSYLLHFGRVFTGSNEELEIGFGDNDEPAKETEEPKSEDKEGDENEDGEEGDEEESTSEKPGRYVFIRVEVDKSLLGDLTKPEEPKKSEELIAAEKKAEEKAKEEAEKPEEAKEPDAESDSADEEESSEEEKKDPEQEELEKLQQAFADAQQKYQDDLKAFEEYEGKLSEATEKAEELNRRFAQWYYVIPGESYDKLALSRNDLLKEKEEEEARDAAASAAGPSLEGLGIDLNPAQMPVTGSDDKTATDADEPAKVEEPAKEEKAEEPAKEEMPTEESKSEESAKEEPAEDKPEEPAKEEPKSEDKPEESAGEDKPEDQPASEDKPAEEEPSGDESPAEDPAEPEESADE